MKLAELIREEIRKENPLAPIMEKMIKAIHDGIKNEGSILIFCNGNIESSCVQDWGSVCIAKKDEYAFLEWCRENGLKMRESWNNLTNRRAGWVLSI